MSMVRLCKSTFYFAEIESGDRCSCFGAQGILNKVVRGVNEVAANVTKARRRRWDVFEALAEEDFER
jgi:hypothetical protein